MDTDRIRADFDEIASVAQEGGSDRYDAFLCALLPAGSGHILDVGCGSGRLSLALSCSHHNVTGIDLSPKMIERARLNAADGSKLVFVCDDFLTHDFGFESFDGIISAAMLHHVPAELAIARMVRLLKPGGRLVIHDVRNASNVWDRITSSAAFAGFYFRSLMRSGRVRTSRAERDAWQRHGAGETYLTMQEARDLVRDLLPGARVIRHALWRYTIVWDKYDALE